LGGIIHAMKDLLKHPHRSRCTIHRNSFHHDGKEKRPQQAEKKRAPRKKVRCQILKANCVGSGTFPGENEKGSHTRKNSTDFGCLSEVCHFFDIKGRKDRKEPDLPMVKTSRPPEKRVE